MAMTSAWGSDPKLLIDRLLRRRDILTPYFDFRQVDTGGADDALLAQVFRLRYEVYCLERHFIDARLCRDGQETDEFDHCSSHFAAFNHGDELVGTVRLVQPAAGQPYPFDSHCQVFDGFQRPPAEATVEISRLIVRKTYRRRRGDSMEGVAREFVEDGRAAAPPSGERRGNSPLLLLGLYREMYRYSRRHGIRYWYAAMERSLAHSLGKMGFRFVPIGPQTDYYGPVTPHMVDLEQLAVTMRRENKFLAAWFSDERIPLWLVGKMLLSQLLERQPKRKPKAKAKADNGPTH